MSWATRAIAFASLTRIPAAHVIGLPLMIPDPQPWWQQLAQLVAACCTLIMAATALLAHPQIRRNWRMLNWGTLPFSVFGGFCALFYPTNSMVVLLLLYPLKGFADPRLDVKGFLRGLKVAIAWKVVLNSLYALFHHAGLVIIVAWIQEMAMVDPRGMIYTYPWALLPVILAEALGWTFTSLILVREAPPAGRYILPVCLAFQAALLVLLWAQSPDNSRSVSLGTMVFGNLLGVICDFKKIDISTYEYAEDVEKGGLERSPTIARAHHKSHIEKVKGVGTNSASKKGSTGSQSSEDDPSTIGSLSTIADFKQAQFEVV